VPAVTFTLLPAVDVANGQAVRHVRAEAGTETTNGAPRDAALAWQRDGAEWIHLVDLDAAFGRGSNAELLAAVVGELDARVQLSGGIADDASLERALATGCDRVNLSTAALADLDWVARAIAAYGERVAVGLDVRIVEREHRLSARGANTDDGDLWEVLARLERDGAARYVVTDVSKDGTLRGPNVELLREVAKATAAPVVASGGIAQIADLVALAQAGADGSNVEGAIVGKALYAGRFTLPEALAAVREVVATSRTAG
jgi:phosphoribosyl isomerase A